MHRQIDKERERERERERDVCVFFLNFVIFFNSENSSTYFKASCISLQKILIDEMSLSDCNYIINGICADGEQAKAFLFSEGRTKV